jgi:hypothetical protein
MKIKSTIIFASLFLIFTHLMGQQNEAVQGMQELKIRDGLPNFLSKVNNGKSVKVAYLGGSITAQEGWRVTSFDWLKQRFPKAKFTEINATIGGTASDFGAFRVGDQVLKFHPDLVFVEFAVNDDGATEERIVRAMEGIVRQIWQHNSKTDICFIYTTKQSYIETGHGLLPVTAVVMEKVAEHYQIPSINFGVEVAKRVADNKLIMRGAERKLNGIDVFSSDGVHPFLATGHVIYNQVFTRSFETLIAKNSNKIAAHKLANKLNVESLTHPKMLDISKGKLSKGWQILPIKEIPIYSDMGKNDVPTFTDFGHYLTTFGKANQTGESLTVHFKGKTIGLYDFMGPAAGKVVVEVDGVVKDTISRFDPWCTYMRMNYFFVDKLEDKEHVVVFKLLSEPFDKATILSQIGNKMENQSDYKENNWYVAKILLDGILLPL